MTDAQRATLERLLRQCEGMAEDAKIGAESEVKAADYARPEDVSAGRYAYRVGALEMALKNAAILLRSVLS